MWACVGVSRRVRMVLSRYTPGSWAVKLACSQSLEQSSAWESKRTSSWYDQHTTLAMGEETPSRLISSTSHATSANTKAIPREHPMRYPSSSLVATSWMVESKF